MLHSVFPHRPVKTPPHLKVNRDKILNRLNLIVDTRNRVMHHEPIMFGIARPDLGSPAPIIAIDLVHQQIVETLGWIDPQCALALSFVDRFPDVYQNEQARIRARVKHHFGLS